MLFRSERKKSLIHHVAKAPFGAGAYNLGTRNYGQIAYNNTYFAETASSFGAHHATWQINVWRLENNTHVIKITPPTGPVHTVLEFLSNNYLASGSENIYIWDIRDGQNIRILKSNPGLYSNDTVYALRLLPDGRLASGESYGRIHIWDTNSENFYKNMRGTHSGPALHCETLEVDRNDVMRDAPTGISEDFMMDYMMHIDVIEYIPENRLLSTGGKVKGDQIFFSNNWNVIRIWDIHSKRCISVLKGGHNFLWTLKAISKDRFVSQECSGARTSSVLYVWDINKKTKISTLQLGVDEHPHILSDGTLVTVEKKSESEYIHHIWDISNISLLAGKRHVMSFVLPNINYFIKLPNNRLLSTTNLEIWDLNPHIELADQPQISISDSQKSVVSPKTIDTEAVTAENNSHILSESKFEFHKINTLKKHNNAVRCSVSLPNNRLASGGDDGEICIWSLDTYRCVLTLRSPEVFWPFEKKHVVRELTTIKDLCLLPNGQLASAAWNFIYIWDISSFVILNRFIKRLAHDAWVYSLQVLSGGRLASGSFDSTIRIWDIEKKQCLITLNASYQVFCLQALHNGRLASLGYYGKEIQIWDVDKKRCISQLFWDVDKKKHCIAQLSSKADDDYVTDHTPSFLSINIFPDGRFVSWDTSSISIWDMINEECLVKTPNFGGFEHNPNCVFYDRYLAIAVSRILDFKPPYERTSTIYIWDIVLKTCVAELNPNKYVTNLQFLSNNQLAISCNNGEIDIYNIGFDKILKQSSFQTQSFAVISQQSADMQKKHASTLTVGQEDDDELLAELEFFQSFDDEASNTTHAFTVRGYDSLSSSSIPQPYFSPTVTSVQPPAVKQKRVSPILSTQSNSVEALSEIEDFSISRENFETLTKQLEKSEKRYAISLEMLEEKITVCKQKLMPSALSYEDGEVLQLHLAKYRKKEALLLERRTILSNPTWEAYYRAIQIHFSGLMVASLGIGSGYVQVSQSKKAKAFKYVASAIGFAFPTHHVSVITSVASDAVNFLDVRARKDFLAKINVFGQTVTEAEILGEKVARFLLRSRVHAGNDISPEQADKDAEALIKAILQASEPIARNKSTAHKLLQMIFGDIPYCIDPLPIAAAVDIARDSSTVSLTLTQSYIGQSTSANWLTSIGCRTEVSHLQDKLDDIEEKTKDTPSQATVTELTQQIQVMQKTLSRLQASDRFVDPVEVVSFSNGAQAQAQLLVKRHNSAHSEHYQELFDRKDQQIVLLEEQMQIMAQQLDMLQENLLSVVQHSLMAEDEKQGIEDDVNSFKSVSVPTQRRASQQRLEERSLKCLLFGQSAPCISDVQNQDIQTEENKKKTEKIALDLKNTIQVCIKASLLEATAEYICFCDAQKGIAIHGGSVSRMDCRALNLLAEQELSTQLFHLIQRFESHTSSSKMGTYSLDTFIVNVLIRKLSQTPLLQTKMSATNLSEGDKSAIKIPRPLFGIYSDSDVVENCFRREQIKRVLITIQQEFIADCSVTEMESLVF